MNRLVKFLYWGVALTLFIFTGKLAQYGWFPEGLKNPMEFLSGTIAGALMIVGGYTGPLLYAAWREKSSRIVAQNCDLVFNPNDHVVLKGKWGIQPIGGVLVRFVNLPSKAGAVIAPLRAWRRYGRMTILRGKLEPVNFLDLDTDVKQALLDNRIPPPYYVSKAPIAIELRGTDFMAEERKLRIINRDEYAESRIAIRSIASADEASRRLAAQMGDIKKPALKRWWDALTTPADKREPATDDTPHNASAPHQQ